MWGIVKLYPTGIRWQFSANSKLKLMSGSACQNGFRVSILNLHCLKQFYFLHLSLYILGQLVLMNVHLHMWNLPLQPGQHLSSLANHRQLPDQDGPLEPKHTLQVSCCCNILSACLLPLFSCTSLGNWLDVYMIAKS